MVSVGCSLWVMMTGTMQTSPVQGVPSALRGRIRSGVDGARLNITSRPSSTSIIEKVIDLRASHSPPWETKLPGLKSIVREAALASLRAGASSESAFEETEMENPLPGLGRSGAVRATKVMRTAPSLGSTV